MQAGYHRQQPLMDLDGATARFDLPLPGVIRRQVLNSRAFISLELDSGCRELLQRVISHTCFVKRGAFSAARWSKRLTGV